MITPQGIKISHDGQLVKRSEQKNPWETSDIQKDGYEHFMLKEIHEQPRIIQETMAEYMFTGEPSIDFYNLLSAHKTVLYLACGTSYNAALIGQCVAERLMDITIKVEMASEFNYRQSLHSPSLTIAITQSGETADTLKAMRQSKENQSRVIAITNVAGSTACKLADYTFLTRAGPEISVAATKSFTAQLITLYWLAISSSSLAIHEKNSLIMGLGKLPDKIQQVLMIKDVVAEYAGFLARYEHVFFIGRSINYPVALEGALKLKEISYIHSEACAAGEIKHGPFALLGKETPVVAIIARDNSYDAMLASIRGIKARDCPVIAIAENPDENITDLVDYLIPVPSIDNLFSPFLNAVAVQLLAYYAARERNCPVDFPRNLAKSVTTE